jgi:DNA invertase Pin-like site-specific DNA recombinase
LPNATLQRRRSRLPWAVSRANSILALIAEFENDIRRERQQDGINKAKAQGVRFGPKPILTAEVVQKVKELRADGLTVPEIMRRTKLSKASIYRALA